MTLDAGRVGHAGIEAWTTAPCRRPARTHSAITTCLRSRVTRFRLSYGTLTEPESSWLGGWDAMAGEPLGSTGGGASAAAALAWWLLPGPWWRCRRPVRATVHGIYQPAARQGPWGRRGLCGLPPCTLRWCRWMAQPISIEPLSADRRHRPRFRPAPVTSRDRGKCTAWRRLCLASWVPGPGEHAIHVQAVQRQGRQRPPCSKERLPSARPLCTDPCTGRRTCGQREALLSRARSPGSRSEQP